jgi:hypothetical protein
MIVLRIIALLFPLVGFIIAIILWLCKQENRADELLFFSFVGIFVNIALGLVFLLAQVIFF